MPVCLSHPLRLPRGSLLPLWTILFALTTCTPPEAKIDFNSEQVHRILAHSPLDPIPENPTNKVQRNPIASELGHALFFSPLLSPHSLSCSDCHQPNYDWSDNRPLAQGVGLSSRNTTSLWNVAYNRWQLWDGRADTLWAQALKPIESTTEMDSSRLFTAHAVFNAPHLKELYEAVFGTMPPMNQLDRFPDRGRPMPSDPGNPLNLNWNKMSPADQHAINVVFTNIGKAIEAFEIKIIAQDSDFDQFVRGLRENNPHLQAALSREEQYGLALFMGKAKCFLCHTGPNFSDGEFHNIGLGPHPTLAIDPGRHNGVDSVLSDPFNGLGRYSDSTESEINNRIRFVTLSPNNQAEFKTPSLRNIAHTAPYMHDGRFQTLEQVIQHYNLMNTVPALGHTEESLVPLELSAEEESQLIAFLHSLTSPPLSDDLMRAPPIEQAQ